MITGWFFAFYRPWRDWHGLFGHVEAYGCDENRSWVFVDPRSTGLQITCLYKFEDVEDAITLINQRSNSILWLPNSTGEFRLPAYGPMTCAAVCGSLVGLRALSVGGLHRKLLAKGAEVVHGQGSEGRPARQGGATA